MRRAPAAAAPIPVKTMPAPASARSVWGNPLRNALLRSRHAYISLAASPPEPPGARAPPRPSTTGTVANPRSSPPSSSLRHAAPASRTCGRCAVGLPADPRPRHLDPARPKTGGATPKQCVNPPLNSPNSHLDKPFHIS